MENKKVVLARICQSFFGIPFEDWTDIHCLGKMTSTDLKSQRNALGLSQTALAALLGVRQATVSDWETGKQPIPHMLSLALEALSAKQ